ncbi:MAG: CbrC family protein [Myxococcaceae bacterium]|nr:CbrC family protein [Myxococcaceae bacterium]MCI0671449.1 CbrC family protein [Myxococcaceae bacterium]
MRTFKYFESPRTSAASSWTEEEDTCDLCGNEGPWYEGPFVGEDDDGVERVCEECLAGGELTGQGLSANTGDVDTLRAQLQALPPAERETRIGERTEELQSRTPPLVTWQDLPWPAHCGDYCRFLGETGRKELDALAPDGNGEAFFHKHVYEADRELRIDFAELPPEAPTRDEDAWEVGVYLFRCLDCGTHVIRWDAN